MACFHHEDAKTQRITKLFFASLCLRARPRITFALCCGPPGPLARRERRAYPLRYVRSEQHSQRACGPQPGGARRRADICGVAAPLRCHHIACVAAPCICPPGARAKMHTLFSDGPLAWLRFKGDGTFPSAPKAAASCRTPKSAVGCDFTFGCGWAALWNSWPIKPPRIPRKRPLPSGCHRFEIQLFTVFPAAPLDSHF